jgi:Protein of unknown function (DUF3237)
VSSSEQSANSVRVPLGQAPLARSVQRARDGSILWWGDADTPVPPAITSPGAAASVTAAVSPVRPGHAVTVEYRVNGGPVRQAIGLPEPRVHDAKARLFRAVLPGQADGLVEFLPVLRFAGQPISPRLAELSDCPRYQVDGAATVHPKSPSDRGTPASVAAANSSAPLGAALAAEPCWAWSTRFLGSLTATFREEAVGVVPDGLRIDWHVKEGSFVGPGLDAVTLPGAADWMRIRNDGVAIVNVQACFETRTGARLYSSYSGILELGRDGYARALRNELPPLPPVVVALTFATADKELEWLNRAQCIGVGRVDTTAPSVELDVYVLEVGGRRHAE